MDSWLIGIVRVRKTAVVGLLLAFQARLNAAAPLDAELFEYTDKYCSGCHNESEKEAGLDLTSLAFLPDEASNFQKWVKVHDRVTLHEMPPAEKKRPEANETARFVGLLTSRLVAAEHTARQGEGRSTRRRLNRSEYEYALRDLLQAPWLQVKEFLPEDGEAFRFNKVSTALDVSYVHMTGYMNAADYALRQVLGVRYAQIPNTTVRYYARDEPAGGLTRFFPNYFNGGGDRFKFPVLDGHAQPEIRAGLAPITLGASDPDTREREAVGWISSSYATGFNSNWINFRAPVAGRYRLAFSGYSVWVAPWGYELKFETERDQNGKPGPPYWFRPNFDRILPGRRSEPITIYAKGGTSIRRLGAFDLRPESGVFPIEGVWLQANEFVVTDASRFYRSQRTGRDAGFTNPLAQRDGMPGVAFRWMEVQGPMVDSEADAGYRLLFGDLPLKAVEKEGSGVAIDVVSKEQIATPVALPLSTQKVEVLSMDPARDAERLLRAFLQRTYRGPVRESDVVRFLRLIRERMDVGAGFAGAMIAGYAAVLASPEFIYVREAPGRLDDNALATRLALFLWNSEPDETLRSLAARGELHRPEVLDATVNRMLVDPRSRRFVEAFLDYWLDLRRMDETTPSATLYNDYYLDDALSEASLDETRLFFADLLQRDLSVRNIVDSDFTYLNGRLAAHYGILGVEGVAMRRVALPAGSERGGLMTQASVLKVTANGTTTSPVLRGKWIMERIVGVEIPPPPAAVPAVEPDIRGAITIRQQLDRHRADESCATCHRKIDPAGFALESFDVMGAWRDQYRSAAVHEAPVHGFGKNGWPFAFRLGAPVDPTGTLPDGRKFDDIRDLKRLFLEDETQIARSFVRQLIVYSTGSPVSFDDRSTVEAILDGTRQKRFGVRTLIRAVIRSDLFLSK